MSRTDGRGDYSARTAYDAFAVGSDYERARFSGAAGRYRRRCELRAVESALERVPPGSHVLDCPTGTGRWWPQIGRRASEIVALDISPGMLEHSRRRTPPAGVGVTVGAGDAEALELDDDSVDWVFSFALTKHLPRPVQYRVLAEFARVARSGVICTFGVFDRRSYELWRRRFPAWLAAGAAESVPLVPEELTVMAGAAGLRLEDRQRCTSPVGVEWVCVFEKDRGR